MSTVLIVIQLLVSVALVAVVLLQRSEGGALGIGGGSGSGGGLFSPRGAGDVLTRTTAILAVAFFATSMALTVLALHSRPQGSILDTPPASAGAQAGKPAGKPVGVPSGKPEVPGLPSPKSPNQ